MKNVHKAFTLVELIVVITILAILGTIAFLSLQGYSQNARDGVRTSDMKNIEKGLGVMIVKSGIVPTPDDTKINIMASGTVIGIQGYAGKLVQAQIGMSKDSGKDPLDGTYYTYSTNATKTQYQLLGFFEGSQSRLVGNSYAVDYSNRFIRTYGSELGILLGTSGSTLNQPAQEFNSGNFETNTTTSNYKTVFSVSNSIVATGTTLASNIYNRGSTECTQGMNEIMLSNGQIWSCMNLGATTVRDGTTQPINCNGSTTNCNSSLTWLGNYYQWGRNDTGFTNGSGALNGDWQSKNDNAWGNTTNTNIARQGPCPNGRHIPSQNEWQLACNNILSTTCTNGMGYNSLITTTLRLPFAGKRDWNTGYYYFESTSAIYWSSTPSPTYSYSFVLTNSVIYTANLSYRGDSFSLRCLKN